MKLKTIIYTFILTVLCCAIACRQKPAADAPAMQQQETKPPPPPQPVDDKTACLLAQVTYLAQPQAALDTVLPGWKLVWDPEPVNGIYAFVAANDRRLALCIRGSLVNLSWDAFNNWVFNDLNIMEQEKWPYADSGMKARVSRGAWLGFSYLNKLKDRQTGTGLLAFLEANMKPETPLLVTGHSLGGNLATVYAPYVYQQFKNAGRPAGLLNVITFAAPAAGNKAFAENFNRWFPQSIRYENSLDMVPKFPCSDAVGNLGQMFATAPHADSITVGYEGFNVSLSSVFKTIKGALWLGELKNGSSAYTQTNGNGTVLKGRVSSRNAANTAAAWFAETGNQHGIAMYAQLLGVKVLAP